MISIGIRIFRISKLRVLHDLDNVMVELEDYIIQEYKVWHPDLRPHLEKSGIEMRWNLNTHQIFAFF